MQYNLCAPVSFFFFLTRRPLTPRAPSELMYCTLSGLRILTTPDLLPPLPPLLGTPGTPPAGWRGAPWSGPASFAQAFGAGAWHDGGEARARADLAGLITFYDPALASLVRARRGTPRAQHRLLNISAADAARKVRELERVLARAPGAASGLDWPARYAGRLGVLNYTLADAPYADAAARAAAARAQLLAMLVPFLTVRDVPRGAGADARAWLVPVLRRCARTHVPAERLTPQEALLRGALAQTQREICRTLALAWADAFGVEGAGAAATLAALGRLRAGVGALMRWLGWAEWVRCARGCAPDVRCAADELSLVGADGWLCRSDVTSRRGRCRSRGTALRTSRRGACRWIPSLRWRRCRVWCKYIVCLLAGPRFLAAVQTEIGIERY
jgi:hypothetical protein